MIPATVDHISIARSRLRQQFKGLVTLDALLSAIISELNTLELVFFGMYTNRSLQFAFGFQLDLWGSVLNVQRNGLPDDEYRIELYAKIGENTSSGTADDVANVYSLLTRARYTHVVEEFPASANLTAVGANIIGTILALKEATMRSSPTGVRIGTFAVVNNIPLVFAEDPDPLGQGLGDLNDPTVGGYLATII